MKLRDAKLVEAVISGRTRAEIAEELEVTERQVYRRLARPEVRTAIEKAGRDMVRLARLIVQREQENAARTLAAIMGDQNAPAIARVAAAKAILDRETKSELDELADRLAELELLARGGPAEPWRNQQ